MRVNTRLHRHNIEIFALVIASIPKVFLVSIANQLFLPLNHDLIVAIDINSVPIMKRLVKVVSL